MTVVLGVPYHLDERLERFDPGLAVDRTIALDLPDGSPWSQMAALHEQVAVAVEASGTPLLVVSGDCTTSLGTVAGLQRAGKDVGLVWFDAHADVHTPTTTTSGYLGGMPLALALGEGEPTLPRALGLRPLDGSRAVLVDARDTDPGEHELLARHGITPVPVTGLDERALPSGELYLHLDVDVCSATELPGLLYPAEGGAGVDAVLAAVGRVLATGRVVAVGLAATWSHDRPAGPAARELVRRLETLLAG